MAKGQSLITFKSRPQTFLLLKPVDACTGKAYGETMLVKYSGQVLAKQANGLYRISLGKTVVYTKTITTVEEPAAAVGALRDA